MSLEELKRRRDELENEKREVAAKEQKLIEDIGAWLQLNGQVSAADLAIAAAERALKEADKGND